MRKYTLYAIGEIALVVIGILIALSINNWNERRLHLMELDQLKNSLWVDLTMDSISISDEIQLLKTDINKLDNFFRRMSKAGIIVDTLNQIARHEYNPVIYGAISFNDNTFNSMRATGYFSKLDNPLQKALIELNEMKRKYESSLGGDIRTYVDLAASFSSKYPFKIIGIDTESELSDKIWNNTDLVGLGVAMNGLLSLKRIIEKDAIDYFEKMHSKIADLMVILEKDELGIKE
jgi:hypothetical protein